ncbi:hypothetical protein XU18_4839 [Perkinsela sp. CCAP 1560/4]|nr:hypothetical protein XU18_4839 [Perkinsela sp. CCAP 1560/4]|eukprot:KNH03763.1 hypothetical protein XU18_4839 [Perkinsela sp. CCAP 1560/4]
MSSSYDTSYWANFLLNVLNNVPGRDKVFKVIQYSYSFRAWREGFQAVDFGALPDAQYSSDDRKAMSIQNTRRLFKIARFVGEWERIQLALLRGSELLHYPEQPVKTMFFIQIQMVLDILARLLSCMKSFLDDILYFSRIGVLGPGVHRPLEKICPRIAIPVIFIDIFLNSLKLIQFIENASTGQCVRHCKSFSLLARYEINEKRKTVLPVMFHANRLTYKNWISHQNTQGYPLLRFTKNSPPMEKNQLRQANGMTLQKALSGVSRKRALLVLLQWTWRRIRDLGVISYYNKEILWCWVSLAKFFIDLTVALSYAFQLKCVHRGHVTVLGILSGVLSVCKIGNSM